MEFTERVLVLKVGRFRESDMWVRFFSPTRGVLTGFAFGGSRSRRRFCGCLDSLNQVLFRVKNTPGNDYLCLMEGSLLKTPTRLRSDYQRLGVAVNCLKFLEAACVGADGAGSYYRLLEETLEVLDTAEHVSSVFPQLFRAKLAFEHGYAPDFRVCAACGQALAKPQATDGLHDVCGSFFCVDRGHVTCADCGPGDPGGAGRAMPLSPGTLKTLAYVRDNGPHAWSRLHMPPQVRMECSRVVDNFVQYHIGLAWDRGSFRRV